jgi:hypothetical protein
LPDRIYRSTQRGVDALQNTIDFYETRRSLRDTLENAAEIE